MAIAPHSDKRIAAPVSLAAFLFKCWLFGICNVGHVWPKSGGVRQSRGTCKYKPQAQATSYISRPLHTSYELLCMGVCLSCQYALEYPS